MTTPSPFSPPQSSAHHSNLKWSKREIVLARKAFNAALQSELHELMQEAKRMASQINLSPDLWSLEQHLTKRRKEIDLKYDFRRSRLTNVLGQLLQEGRLAEQDLGGLEENKLKLIRTSAKLRAEIDAA